MFNGDVHAKLRMSVSIDKPMKRCSQHTSFLCVVLLRFPQLSWVLLVSLLRLLLSLRLLLLRWCCCCCCCCSWWLFGCRCLSFVSQRPPMTVLFSGHAAGRRSFGLRWVFYYITRLTVFRCVCVCGYRQAKSRALRCSRREGGRCSTL